MKIAVIDAGTNTFTMNVFQLKEDQSFEKMPKMRFYVNLAEDGIDCIGEAAQQRAIYAFEAFRKELDRQQVDKALAFGTSALRRASNGTALIEAIRQRTAIAIELIDGQREAELIYWGVREAAPLGAEAALIVDIGGGSVELIVCNATEHLWSQSFPLGAAFLYYQFVQTDPISPKELNDLKKFLKQGFKALEPAIEKFKPKYLIGASGTFDALEAMIGTHQQQATYGYITLAQLRVLYQQLLPLNYEARKALPKMPRSRAKLIIVAMLVVEFLIEAADIQTDLIISDYAMREGAFFEFLQQEQH